MLQTAQLGRGRSDDVGKTARAARSQVHERGDAFLDGLRRVLDEERLRGLVGNGGSGQGGINCPGAHLVPLVVWHEPKIRVQPQIEGVFPQDTRAGPVYGADPRVVYEHRLVGPAYLAQGRLDARTQLGGRLFGEGDGHDLLDALDDRSFLPVFLVHVESLCHALAQGKRFAGPGAGDDSDGSVEGLRAGDLPAFQIGKAHPNLPSHAATGQCSHASLLRGFFSTQPASMRATTCVRTMSSTAHSSSIRLVFSPSGMSA